MRSPHRPIESSFDDTLLVHRRCSHLYPVQCTPTQIKQRIYECIACWMQVSAVAHGMCVCNTHTASSRPMCIRECMKNAVSSALPQGKPFLRTDSGRLGLPERISPAAVGLMRSRQPCCPYRGQRASSSSSLSRPIGANHLLSPRSS